MKAQFIQKGDVIQTENNASGQAPVTREVESVLTRIGITEIRCADGSVHRYAPRDDITLDGEQEGQELKRWHSGVGFGSGGMEAGLS
ncbi:MAG: hypothetical protein JST59_16200 [Actinobacteria bacterium]|nr:hypothetical protein [Actinomycetota bacterium]